MNIIFENNHFVDYYINDAHISDYPEKVIHEYNLSGSLSSAFHLVFSITPF